MSVALTMMELTPGASPGRDALQSIRHTQGARAPSPLTSVHRMAAAPDAPVAVFLQVTDRMAKSSRAAPLSVREPGWDGLIDSAGGIVSTVPRVLAAVMAGVYGP
jgi:hypothetical protein